MSKDLHDQIMNIPCKITDEMFLNKASRLLYKDGHRDARHAAAELALSAPTVDDGALPELPPPARYAPNGREPENFTKQQMQAYARAAIAAAGPNKNVKPIGTIKVWNKGGSGQFSSIEGFNIHNAPDGMKIYSEPVEPNAALVEALKDIWKSSSQSWIRKICRESLAAAGVKEPS